MQTPMKSFLSGVVFWFAAVGCSVDSAPGADDTEHMTGTEEAAVILAPGVVACTNPDKVLVCHIPPGNPANAHEICVGAAAVDAHQSHHGDTLGACTPPDDDDDDDDDMPPGGGGGGDDAPIP